MRSRHHRFIHHVAILVTVLAVAIMAWQPLSVTAESSLTVDSGAPQLMILFGPQRLLSCETINCLPRRESGPDKFISFRRGEAVKGQWIWEGDNLMYRCFLPAARSDGWAQTAAVNPWPGEIDLPNC